MTKKKPTAFHPNFTITPATATGLMRIEAVKQAIQTLPITPCVLAYLRETAGLFSTHYSTMIEGNRLTQEQVAQVIGGDQHFPGRQSKVLRNLDAKQRKALTLFQKSREITAKDIAELFGYQPRTATLLCQRWVEDRFLETTDPAKKSRRYKLNDTYEAIIDEIE